MKNGVNVTLEMLLSETTLTEDEIPFREEIEKVWVFTSSVGGAIIHHNNPEWIVDSCRGRDVRIVFFYDSCRKNIALDAYAYPVEAGN